MFVSMPTICRFKKNRKPPAVTMIATTAKKNYISSHQGSLASRVQRCIPNADATHTSHFVCNVTYPFYISRVPVVPLLAGPKAVTR